MSNQNKYTIVNGQLYNTDELYHFGVPGMKWNKRAARGIAGGARKTRDKVLGSKVALGAASRARVGKDKARSLVGRALSKGSSAKQSAKRKIQDRKFDRETRELTKRVNNKSVANAKKRYNDIKSLRSYNERLAMERFGTFKKRKNG